MVKPENLSNVLSESQIEKINKLDGKGFSEKIRYLVDDYFNPWVGVKTVYEFAPLFYLHSFNLNGKIYELPEISEDGDCNDVRNVLNHPIENWATMLVIVFKYLKDTNPNDFQNAMSKNEDLIKDLKKWMPNSVSYDFGMDPFRCALSDFVYDVDESIDLSFNVWTIGGKDPHEITIDIPLPPVAMHKIDFKGI
ncbi:MAG: hypothetical protein LBM96_08460 [Methanobrevibacter sp.]|jgi:hypothetical protein|nr:hypothetical protein [Candidatus Methanoflexus mossambicus]